MATKVYFMTYVKKEAILNSLIDLYESLENGRLEMKNWLDRKMLLAFCCRYADIDADRALPSFSQYRKNGYDIHLTKNYIPDSSLRYPLSGRSNWFTMTGASSIDGLNLYGDFLWDATDFSLSVALYFMMESGDFSYEEVLSGGDIMQVLEEAYSDYYVCPLMLYILEGMEFEQEPEEKKEEYLKDVLAGAYYIRCRIEGTAFEHEQIKFKDEKRLDYYESFLSNMRENFISDDEFRLALPYLLYAMFSFSIDENEATVQYMFFSYHNYNKYLEIQKMQHPLVEKVNKIADMLFHPVQLEGHIMESDELEGLQDEMECFLMGIPVRSVKVDPDSGIFLVQYLFYSSKNYNMVSDYMSVLSVIFETAVDYIYELKVNGRLLTA